jgi:hypothetical protein
MNLEDGSALEKSAVGDRVLGDRRILHPRQRGVNHLPRDFHFALCASLWFIVPWQPHWAALKDLAGISVASRLPALAPF